MKIGYKLPNGSFFAGLGIQRVAMGIKCVACGVGYAETVDCTDAECVGYGCGRDHPGRECCAAAFVCAACGARNVARREARGARIHVIQTTETEVGEMPDPTENVTPLYEACAYISDGCLSIAWRRPDGSTLRLGITTDGVGLLSDVQSKGGIKTCAEFRLEDGWPDALVREVGDDE